MMKRSVALASFLILAGCGGGSSGGPTLPVATSSAAPAAVVPVSFTIVIPKSTNALRRRPNYISPSTANASISVNAGAPTSAACSSVCTVMVNAPVGTDTFAIALTDAYSTLLSSGSTTQIISPTIANSVHVAFGGIVAKIALTATMNSFTTGSVGTTTVNVVTTDADNNVIVGSDPYINPVTLTNTDTSGFTSLSTTTLNSPATSATTFSYTGNLGLGNSTLTLSASASGVTSANIRPATISIHYASGTIIEYAVPTTRSQVNGIAAGHDGNVWFTEQNANKIGRITQTGVISEFGLPNSNSGPAEIIAGAGNIMWFTEQGGGRIGQILTGSPNTITEYGPLSQPYGVTLANDGNLYIAEFLQGSAQVAKFDTATTAISQYGRVAGVQAFGIVQGPDGNLFVTAPFPYNPPVYKLDLRGALLSQFGLPSGAQGRGIVVGPDGNLWFADDGTQSIWRSTTGGTLTQFSGSGIQYPVDIVSAPDGTLWFTNGDKIGQITTAGVVTLHSLPTSGTFTSGITVGPDGNIWFTETSPLPVNNIGRYIL